MCHKALQRGTKPAGYTRQASKRSGRPLSTCHPTPTGSLLPLTTLLPVMEASKGPSPTMAFSTQPLGQGAGMHRSLQ